MNMRISKAIQSHRTNVPGFLLLGALLLGASACAPSNTGRSAPPAGEQATTAPQAVAPGAARDVTAMNACALFPGDAVASALNTSLVDPTNTGAGFGADCTYYLLPSGGGGGAGQLYNLFLMPPELYDLSLSALENAQPVAGLGDQASMGTRVGTTINDLMVLKTGDIMIEINGEDAGTLQKMAAYILANLP